MASSFAIAAPEDVLNVAFARLGFRLRIGSIWEGSDHAKKALDIYVQTRDDVLRDGEWPFAERNVAATVLKEAPTSGYVPPNTWSAANHPPIPWLYEFSWPADCLKVRAVKPIPITAPNFDPSYNLFTVLNDSVSLQRVICANVANAVIVYTGQITDLSQWPVDALEALAAALARRLPQFASMQDAVKIEAADEQIETTLAGRTNG